MRRECTHAREKQRVVIIGRKEGGDGGEAIAAGTVLDHNRLAPALLQPLRDESG
jgi:hypothetical protein